MHIDMYVISTSSNIAIFHFQDWHIWYSVYARRFELPTYPSVRKLRLQPTALFQDEFLARIEVVGCKEKGNTTLFH